MTAAKKLTSMQEKAAQLKVEGMSKADAYRGAGYKVDKMKPETLHRAAVELFDNPKVSARVAELEERALKKHDVTLDGLTKKLERVFEHALKDDRGAKDAVAAVMAQAKLVGLDDPSTTTDADPNKLLNGHAPGLAAVLDNLRTPAQKMN
jgi:phage terminase small subunit